VSYAIYIYNFTYGVSPIKAAWNTHGDSFSIAALEVVSENMEIPEITFQSIYFGVTTSVICPLSAYKASISYSYRTPKRLAQIVFNQSTTQHPSILLHCLFGVVFIFKIT